MTVGNDLIEAMTEAVAHANGKAGDLVVHEAIDLKAIRERAKLTQKQMAPIMGMSLSGYRKWEQGERTVSGPARTLLKVLQKNPGAVLDAVATG